MSVRIKVKYREFSLTAAWHYLVSSLQIVIIVQGGQFHTYPYFVNEKMESERLSELSIVSSTIST